MSDCNCSRCKQYSRRPCKNGYPRMVWLSEHFFFTIGIFVKDDEEFEQCLDSLVYMINFKNNLTLEKIGNIKK